MAVFESKGAWDSNTVREWLQVVKRGQKEVTLAKYSGFVPRREVNSRNETVSASSKAGRCLSESDARVSAFPLVMLPSAPRGRFPRSICMTFPWTLRLSQSGSSADMIDTALSLFMLQAARASKRIEVYIEVFNGTIQDHTLAHPLHHWSQ